MKGIIYKITNSETCYIGQTTTTLKQRWWGHKNQYHSFINGNTNWCSSYIMFMNDEEPTIEILEDGEFESKKHLTAVETSYIMANDCCNKSQQIKQKKVLLVRDILNNIYNAKYQKSKDKIAFMISYYQSVPNNTPPQLN